MVRSNDKRVVGFLSNARRLNVAVTRARRFLCIIGDSETLESDETLKSLLEYCRSHGEVKSAMEFKEV